MLSVSSFIAAVGSWTTRACLLKHGTSPVWPLLWQAPSWGKLTFFTYSAWLTCLISNVLAHLWVLPVLPWPCWHELNLFFVSGDEILPGLGPLSTFLLRFTRYSWGHGDIELLGCRHRRDFLKVKGQLMGLLLWVEIISGHSWLDVRDTALVVTLGVRLDVSCDWTGNGLKLIPGGWERWGKAAFFVDISICKLLR
jgi:hypothetical protein